MLIKGINSNAGSSIQNHPQELLIMKPHPSDECLPYGALTLLTIRKEKVNKPMIIHNKIYLSKDIKKHFY
jgi:hypothetical protein